MTHKARLFSPNTQTKENVMKQILIITLLTTLLTFSAQAQNSEEVSIECRAIRAQVIQNISTLRLDLEKSDNEDTRFYIRLKIIEQFKIMDKTVVYSLENVSCKSLQFQQMEN